TGDTTSELEEVEIKYLFPYFLRFDYIHQIEVSNEGTTILSGSHLIAFKVSLYKALSELLDECYEEPPIKRRQKHPTLFEKFYFKEKKYIVDYTTSIIGRLMYTLYLRLCYI